MKLWSWKMVISNGGGHAKGKFGGSVQWDGSNQLSPSMTENACNKAIRMTATKCQRPPTA